MDYKVTEFNYAAFNQILLILNPGYHPIYDQDYLIISAYMNQLKKYANVMSNLNWSIPIECKAVKFNALQLISSSRRLLCIISTALPPGLASNFRVI
jgi:hypothetical protein